MAMTAAAMAYPTATILCPLPTKWKGNMDKGAFTKKSLRELGLELTARGLQFADSTARLPGTISLSKRRASHVIDALALARWSWMRQPR
jgi:hypothetical protein